MGLSSMLQQQTQTKYSSNSTGSGGGGGGSARGGGGGGSGHFRRSGASVGSSATVKMKVTVCFGNVRVIVPCSNPEMLVRDLIHQASLRYKKATGKGPESWVVVHKLKSQSDGGILDPDDKLVDVADDREQIMAIYEEDNDGMPSLQHNAGDGTSASSVGTNSPDIFQGSDHKFQPFARTDIEITGEELGSGPGNGTSSGGGLTLQVRRGSEPALNRLSPVHLSPPDPSKRWSAAPKIDEDKDDHHQSHSFADGDTQQEPHHHQLNASVLSENNGSVVSVSVGDASTSKGNGENVPGLYQKHTKCSTSSSNYGGGGVNAQINQRSGKYGTMSASTTGTSGGSESGSRFSRDHHRLSMQFVGDGGYKWAEAADRALSLSLRKEPLGANEAETPVENFNLIPPQHFSTPTSEYPKNGLSEPKRMLEIVLKHEAGPLGIHVVPDHNADARNQGLIVQSVEPGGRIDRDGRVQANDKIVEINGQCLIGVQFQKAQELFRDGLKSSELRLKVLKYPGNILQDFYSEVDSEKENMIEGQLGKIVGGGDSKVATVSQTKKLPLQPTGSLPRSGSGTGTTVGVTAATTNLIQSNTRKIGRKYEIDLQKGPQGLGFSITTRDNPAGGNCPIYIKNILPTGAAIEDGRLRPGDRLLEVNGIEITGKTQAEAVSILRNIPQGGIVKLVVSRQERVDLSPKLPRQIPPDKIEDDSLDKSGGSLWSEREMMTLDIPVLDTEKAGLGISVKGKTNAVRGKMLDMGIFIKSVIHGGAASRDGRLKSNDQLLNINGVSLLNRSNTDAMETLRRTMTQDGGPKPKPGFITLSIARRVPSSSAPTTDLSGGASSASGDETDSWSKNVSMSVDGSRTENSVTIESLNKSLMSNGDDPHNNAIFVQQLAKETPLSSRGSGRQSYPNHVRSSSLRRVSERSPVKAESEARVRHRSPPPYFVNTISNTNGISSPHPINPNNGVGVVDLPRNPVLDRLTGKSPSGTGPGGMGAGTGNNPARNDSYYKATNDTWNSSAFVQSVIPSRCAEQSPNAHLSGGNAGLINNHLSAVTVHNSRGEMVLVEDDYVAPQKPPRRSRSSTPIDGLVDSSGNGVVGGQQKGGNSSRVSTPVSSVTTVTNQGQPPSDVTYASQTSLEDLGGFSRDAFGRQSMSEKRHATLDAKSTDTYQRNKKVRDERQRQKQHEEAHAEQLARERNMQDQLARRGIKRPFSSSTEDDLALRSQLSPSQNESQSQSGAFTGNDLGGTADGITLGHHKGFPLPNHAYPAVTTTQRINKYSVIGKRGDRLGLGDQLLQLLQHWGQSRQTPRTDVIGLPRVNSADSLVDAVKHSQHHHASNHHQRNHAHQQTPSSSGKGKKSKGQSGGFKKDIGPSLGMKKSSSLESLQTMVQEIQIQEDVKSGYGPPRAGPTSVRVVRGRGCNESFRQAVDRSYEAPLGELANQMETLAEEETESCGRPYGGGGSGRKSGGGGGGGCGGDIGGGGGGDYYGGDAEGTYGKTKGVKKKQGIFRGLGSMFRFGRHRKSAGATSSAAAAAAAVSRQQQLQQAEAEQQQAQAAAAAAHARLHGGDLQQNQHHQDYRGSYQVAPGPGGGYPYIHRQNHPHLSGSLRVAMPHGSGSGKSNRKSEGSSRADSKDINGNTHGHGHGVNHGRSTSIDVYNEMTRPGSRVGIVDPKKYTHYINYEEIRHHLNDNKITASSDKNSQNNNGLSEAQLRQMRLTVVEQRKKAILESRRHQQHYHSQRREHPRDRQERPVSNFYEYESIQAAMHAAASSTSAQTQQAQSPPSGSLAPHHHPHALITNSNSNSNQLHHLQHSQHPNSHPHSHPHPPQHHMSPPPPSGGGSGGGGGLVLHGQPIYGMSSAQLNRLNNNNSNNGITLPSPSGPFTVAMQQTSPSQFQVVSIASTNTSTPVNSSPSRQIPSSSNTMDNRGGGNGNPSALHHPSLQYSQGLPQRPKPNSLPRRSHKAEAMHPLVSSGPFPSHFPLVPSAHNQQVHHSSNGTGRYSIHFPHSHQQPPQSQPQSSYVHIQDQSVSLAGNVRGVPVLPVPVPHHLQQQMGVAVAMGGGGGRSHLVQHPSYAQLHQHQHSTPSTNVGSKV